MSVSAVFSKELKKEELDKLKKAFSIVQDVEKGLKQDDYFIAAYEAVKKACKTNDWNKIQGVKDILNRFFNSLDRTLLIEAIIQRNKEVVKGLIEQKIAVLTPDEKGDTPLHHAARQGSQDLVKLLNFVDIDVNNHLNQTPLHVACDQGQAQIVETLLANGASSDLEGTYYLGESKFSFSPLQVAIVQGRKNCIDIFFNDFSKTPYLQEHAIGSIFHLSIKFGRIEAFEYLLQFHLMHVGELIDRPNADGKTPLMLAAELGDGKAISLLIEKRANIEARDRLGQTALHWAAKSKQRDSIQLLAYFNANLQSIDTFGKTPVDYLKGEIDEESQSLVSFLSNLVRQKEVIEQKPPLFTFRPPENLVFKGGGVKGLAYVGAIKILEEKGILGEVKRVAGTSAGAITSTLLAMQYNSLEIGDLFIAPDMMSKFLDHPFTGDKILDRLKHIEIMPALMKVFSIVKTALTNPIDAALSCFKDLAESIWNTTGLCEGEVFRSWMEACIKKKTGMDFCTFGELRQLIEQGKPFKHLNIFTLRMNPQEIVHIHSENSKFDNYVISDVVRASMSIPGIFKPHHFYVLQIDPKTNKRARQLIPIESYLDGGLLANFPIEAFDKKKYQVHIPLRGEGEYYMLNKRTLGFSLYSLEESDTAPPEEPKTIGDLLKSIVSMYWQAEDLIRSQVIYNKYRVIDIDSKNIGPIQSGLNDKQKQSLIDSGKKATSDFFERQERSSAEMKGFFLTPKASKEAQGIVRLRQPDPDFIGRESDIREMEEVLLSKGVNKVYSFLLWGKEAGQVLNKFQKGHSSKFSLAHRIDCSTQEKREEGYRKLAEKLGLEIEVGEKFVNYQDRILYRLEETSFRDSYLLLLENVPLKKNFLDYVVPVKVEAIPPKLPQRGRGSVIITSQDKPGEKQLEVMRSEAIEIKPEITQQEECIRRLEKTLLPKLKVAIPSLLLWGEGGIGKSEIAATFANTHVGDFSLIYWIDCGTPGVYEKGYKGLAHHLRIPVEKDEAFDNLQERVHSYLEEEHFNLPYLLILDNALTLPKFPEQGKGAILITSRKNIEGNLSKRREIKRFDKEEALALIHKILRKPKVQQEEKLIDKLGYFPLALSQAAHYIATPPVMQIEQFLKILEDNTQEIINKTPSTLRYPLSFAASWHITAKAISETYPLALEWLHFISYLYPEAIPTSWAEDWLDLVKKEVSGIKRLQKAHDEILRPLENYALIHEGDGNTMVSVSHLNQEMVQNDIQYFPENIRESVLSFLLEKIKMCTSREELEFRIEFWESFKIWELHAEWFLKHLDKGSQEEKVAKLYHALASWKELRGHYADAYKYFESALKIWKELKLESTEDAIRSVHGLGWLYAKQEKNQQAREQFEKEEKWMEKNNQIQSPQYANVLHGQAWTYGNEIYRELKLGKITNKEVYEKAKELFRKALGIRNKLAKKYISQPNLAAIICLQNDLGWILEKEGKLKEAKDMFQEAKENEMKLFGKGEKLFEKDPPKHPYVASTYHNLGRIAESNKNYKEASDLHEKALAINESLYDKETNVYVLRSLNNLLYVLEKLIKENPKDKDTQGRKDKLNDRINEVTPLVRKQGVLI